MVRWSVVALLAGSLAGTDVPERVIVRSAGRVSVGGVVSRTVTVNVVELVLPDASFAVQLTVVTPSGNVDPLEGVHATIGRASQRSVAVGVA